MSHLVPLEKQSDAPALTRLAFTTKETAHILGLSYPTIIRLNQRGLLKSSTALRHKLFPKTEIERFLKTSLP